MPRLLKKSTPPPPPRGTFIGRTRELHEFRSSVRYVLGVEKPPGNSSRYPHIFFLHGEDGMGKTALLRQFLAIAREEGIPDKRCLLLNLNTTHNPTPDVLAQRIAETLRQQQGKSDKHYQQACSQRDNLAPYVKELQQQWARWVALREHENSDLETIIQSRYNPARLPEAKRAGFARLHEPGHIELQTAWATEGLAALITFRQQHSRLPYTFEELLHNELGNDALLFLPDGGTSAALAEDLYTLAEHAPLLLLLDSYEYADQHDETFCTAILSRSSDRMLTVVAGHSPPHPVYRRVFGGEHASLLHTYDLSQHPFHEEEVRVYLHLRTTPDTPPPVLDTPNVPLLMAPTTQTPDAPIAFQPPALSGAAASADSLTSGIASDAFAMSRGIPLALAILGDYLATYNTIQPFHNSTPLRSDAGMRVCALVQRFLTIMQGAGANTNAHNPARQQQSQREVLAIRSLAILLRPDEEMVCACWGLSRRQAQQLALHLAQTTPSFFAGYGIYELHPLVHTCIRNDTHTAKYRADDWHMLKTGIAQVLPVIQKRLKHQQRVIKQEQERYQNASWCATILDILNVCFWLSEEDEARSLLLNHWIGARANNPSFAEQLATLATELAPRTPEWRRMISAMQEDDLTMFDPFITTLEPHARVVLYYLRAQRSAVWYVEDTADLKRINQHIMLLEHGYALDGSWQPIGEALTKAYATRGRYAYQQKEYKPALEDFNRSLHLQPDQPAILASRAAIKHYLGNDADALVDYNRSLKVRPDHPITLTNRGVIKYYQGDYRGALADYTRSLELRPDHPITLYNRGVVHRITGDLDKALTDFDHAIQVIPNDPDTLNSRGVVKQSLGDHSGALADLDHALQVRPDDPDVLYNRGVVKEYLGRYADALSDFDRSLALRPYDPATLDNRGVAKVHMGDYEGALKDYDRSLVLRPDHPVTLENRGVAKAYLGYYDGALKDYERALDLRPDDPSPRYNIACLYALQNKVEDALAWLERILAQHPNWRDKAQHDPDFAMLQHDPRFQALLSGGEREPTL